MEFQRGHVGALRPQYVGGGRGIAGARLGQEVFLEAAVAHALKVGEGDQVHLLPFQRPAWLEVVGERRPVQLVGLRPLVGEEEVARVAQSGLGERANFLVDVDIAIMVRVGVVVSAGHGGLPVCYASAKF